MEYGTIVENWRLDRRFYYVRDGSRPHAPFLAVVDDFGNLIAID